MSSHLLVEMRHLCMLSNKKYIIQLGILYIYLLKNGVIFYTSIIILLRYQQYNNNHQYHQYYTLPTRLQKKVKI